MNFFRNLKISTKIFQTHRARTILSVIGIIIGITSVIAIINAGQSFKHFIKKQVEIFGTNYIEIEVKVPNTNQTSMENVSGLAKGVTITTLKYEEGEKIKKHPNISEVYMGAMGQELISYQNTNKQGLLWGVSSGFFTIDKTKIKFGRDFTEEEDKSLAQVVILGHEIKQDLFGDDKAVGKRVKIGKNKFKVIGVREKVGNVGFINMDKMLIVPVKTLQKKIMGIDHITFIMASVIDTKKAKQTANDIIQMMRKFHNITDPNKDDFAVVTSKEAMEMLNVILNGITLFLVAIAGISLIVGGVGIMNIMYVSVLERTYEIGLRKAIGATNKDILKQFLGETILITLIGGIIGIIFGLFLSLIISSIAQSKGFDLEFIISIPGIIIASAFMILVGLIFGIYPAKKAARLNPVEALRYE